MTKRSWPLLGLAWLVVVGLVATATWWAIDTAGRDVLSGPSTLTDESLTATGGPAPTSRPPKKPGHRPTARPSESPGPTPDSTPDSTPTPKPTANPSVAPTAQTRTWRGSAGTLVTQCLGGRVTLKGASPADGYSLEVGSRGAERVEVTFRRSGANEVKVKVRSECEGGVPVFDVESESENESD